MSIKVVVEIRSFAADIDNCIAYVRLALDRIHAEYPVSKYKVRALMEKDVKELE